MTRVIGVIPARYASTRFPGKALADIGGRPMIEHVYRRACAASSLSEVVVATDDQRILEAVLAFGGKAMLTSPDHPSGTDRVAEAVRGCACDLVVNIQGDEPLLPPEMIDQAARPLLEDSSIPVGTLASPIADPAELDNPNVVKVVFDLAGFALYFSRFPIPFERDRESAVHYRHVGLYAYRKSALLALAALPPTRLELAEKLEQLRALEHGYRIKVTLTEALSPGVDTPGDLEIVRRLVAGASG